MEDFDETYANTRLGAVRKPKEKKRDWLVRLSTAQLVLALLGAALLLTVSKVSPAGFETLRVSFERVMSVDLGAREVLRTIRQRAEKLAMSVPEPTSEAQGGADGGSGCFAPITATVEMIAPVTGRITSPFGYRIHPITKKKGLHNGVDIAAAEGTPIAAAFNGTVEEVGSNSVRGNYIVLSHGANTKTCYWHCSEILAEKGAVIRAGEIIAKVGHTGWATGPHLHFCVVIHGVYYNPAWLLP